MNTYKFPEDFERKEPDEEAFHIGERLQKMIEFAGAESYYGRHWLLKDEDKKTLVSIIGGGLGHHGDGLQTFEMWDYREGEPQGYLTMDEINEHLTNNPYYDVRGDKNSDHRSLQGGDDSET